MSETVGIRYEVEGTAEAAAAVGVLTGAVAEVGPATEEASSHLDRFSEVAQESTQQAIQFGQRLQSAAAAVQSLSSVMGGNGEAAALIGRVTQTSVAFAQLGGLLGPGGALVGGIIGAAIPAWQSFMSALEPVVPELEQMTSATDANTAALLQQASAADTAAESLRGFLESLDPSSVQSRLANNGEQIRALSDELAGLGRGTLEQLNRRQEIEAEIGRLTRQAAELGDEVVSLSGGRGERSSHGASAPNGGDAEAARHFAESGAIHEAERLQAIEDAQRKRNDALAEEIALRERAQEQARITFDLEQRYYDDAAARDQERLALMGDEQDAVLAARAEHVSAMQAEATSAVSSLMSSLTTVFTAMAQGQVTAEEGAKLVFANFLSEFSTRAGVEGLGEVARAISDFASYNYAGGAGHLAAAAAWEAAAVATGVGSNVLSAEVSKSSAARSDGPESPRGSLAPSTGGEKRPAIVVNMNAPTVIGGSQAEWGRAAEASIRVAQRRYGRASP